jgi:phosphatidylglycerol lysyltransferase
MALTRDQARRWLLPAVSVALFAAASWAVHRELAQAHLHEALAQARAVTLPVLGAALAATLASYLLLGCYDWLGLRYLGRDIAAGRAFFTAFIANAFGHNLGIASLTGAAVRYRMYGTRGLNAPDVATLAGFCSLTSGLGLATLAGASLVLAPAAAGGLLHLRPGAGEALGLLLLALPLAWLVWAATGRSALELRGWTLRPPSAPVALGQVVVATADMAVSAAVLWVLLPADAGVGFTAFAGIYAVAVVAGIVSHVPGGLGVFESVMLIGLRGTPAGEVLGALLLWRLVYYLLPLLVASLFFGVQELGTRRALLARVGARVGARAGAYIAPVAPQLAGALVFVAGFVLLLSGSMPAVATRLHAMVPVVPLPVLELSHLAGSVIGLALLVIARALLRRLHVAWRATLWLLAAGAAVSLLKGLDFEEALLMLAVMGLLWLGKSGFYRRSSLLEARLTPAWIASVLIAIGTATWIGYFSQRHVDYAGELWWTFAFDADAPRVLRALFVVSLLAASVLALNLLRPAAPEPGTLDDKDLADLHTAIAGSSSTLACAALTGDKRILFSEQRDAFIMYQVSGRSWIALGDPVGPRARHEELVWRFRELSDEHGGWCVFYQATAECLPLYVDLGLKLLKLGEEARIPLADFSLEGSARAELRTQRRRAQKDGASFEVVPVEQVDALLPQLRRVSDAWLKDKATAEKGFSVGAFDEAYVSQFPVAIVRAEGEITAFANLWAAADHEELSVDLMRFSADAPRAAMDFLFVELLLWGHEQGYRWMNLGMAPLAGLERHPLAPAWNRVGNFVFRYGEHFYNFDGLRRYKAKFNPEWAPRYLVAPGGMRLPRILVDASVLIAGGLRELLAK